MSLLPSRTPVDREHVGPSLRTLGEGSDRAFDALKAKTARKVLSALCEEPAVASEVAERVGTSLQNVHYHLENLREAELVEVVDTWYSSKGTEMKVYAPAGDPLMLIVGGDDEVAVCREALEALD